MKIPIDTENGTELNSTVRLNVAVWNEYALPEIHGFTF